jgi:hypothetical protein
MRKRSFVFAIGAALALFAVSSCQKETNDGMEGPPGPKGDTGVANVIYSEWIDVQYDWLVQPPDDTLGLAGFIDAPKLTDDIIDKGTIKVYLNLGSEQDPFITAVPYLDPLTGITITPYFFPGQIQVFSFIDGSTFMDGNEKLWQYRYVLIPGGVLASKPANVNLDNYSEAKKYLKIN